MERLTGKNVLITGASSGIGQARRENWQATSSHVSDALTRSSTSWADSPAERASPKLTTPRLKKCSTSTIAPHSFIARAMLPQMRKQGSGRIMAVASRQGVEPAPMLDAYSASKAALASLIRTIAIENKDRCITANTVLPGTMDTPANRAADATADASQWVQPSQVAGLLVHLASDAGAQITGAAIPIYGKQV